VKVLVVGGTADGRKLATALFELGFDVIYSIAGIVRKATLPCEVISGGFTQFGGLAQYVLDKHITHIVDATHPFAQTMSNTIATVSETLDITALRFHRRPWPKTAQDQWVEVSDWQEVIEQLPEQQSLFMTAGQVEQAVIDALAAKAKHVLLRTAMPANLDLPDNVTWLKAIGPFTLDDEKRLLAHYQIDIIISKNSGGDATYAKIKAAAESSIPVYQFKRPALKPLAYQCEQQSECVSLLHTFKHKN